MEWTNLEAESKLLAINTTKALKENLIKEGLGDSKLFDSIFATVDGLNVEVFMSEYGFYVDSGRPKGIFPPPDAFNSWTKETGGSAWGAAVNIYKNGIQPKKFIIDINDIQTNIVQAGKDDCIIEINKIIK